MMIIVFNMLKLFSIVFKTVALNHRNIANNPQRISKIKPFNDEYNWKEIDFPLHSKDWKKFEQNNKAIALNILFVTHNTKEIRHAHKSKHNFKWKNQAILLMITDGKKWYYLAVKTVSSLLRAIISNHDGDFYCLNFSFREHKRKAWKIWRST